MVNKLLIKLNDKMLDLNKKVTVEYKGKTIYSAIPKRSFATIWNSLNERNDLEQVFCAEIELTLNEE